MQVPEKTHSSFHENESSYIQTSTENIHKFQYFTHDDRQMNVVELMNLLAFGGLYKDKLYQFMQKHIK